MDIRNVQKTGNMFYVYLPTIWCRAHGITSKSKISLNTNNDGTLTIHPQITKGKKKNIALDISETDQDIINKLIVACYINPAGSFNINLKNELTATKLLDQKKLISVELVEFDGKHISCESSITVEDPMSLLITMIRKISNMLLVMKKNYNKELIERYEEEIDRSNLLIEKAVLAGLVLGESLYLRPADLHYLAILAKELERLVDRLKTLESSEKPFFDSVSPTIDFLKEMFGSPVCEKNKVNINHERAIAFTKLVKKIKQQNPTSASSYSKTRIRNRLISISEILFDWSITNELLSSDHEKH